MYFRCDQSICNYVAKTHENLTSHLWQVHTIGECKYFRCDQDDCDYVSKTKGSLKTHLWQVHTVGNGTLFRCYQDDCDYVCKINSTLRVHLENVHDVGTLVCDYCVGNCFKRILHHDINVGKQYICRKCYKKVTGYESRAEEQMVQAIKSNMDLSPYIILKDRIVAHDSCNTKRRPDLLLSSGELHMIVECDENQHRHSNYTPTCEWGRMDEMLDEFKEGKVVFVRWNPDRYTVSKGEKRKSREERLKMLVNMLVYLAQNPPSDHIAIYYMFYDRDNPIVADRWKTQFIA